MVMLKSWAWVVGGEKELLKAVLQTLTLRCLHSYIYITYMYIFTSQWKILLGRSSYSVSKCVLIYNLDLRIGWEGDDSKRGKLGKKHQASTSSVLSNLICLCACTQALPGSYFKYSLPLFIVACAAYSTSMILILYFKKQKKIYIFFCSACLCKLIIVALWCWRYKYIKFEARLGSMVRLCVKKKGKEKEKKTLKKENKTYPPNL